MKMLFAVVLLAGSAISAPAAAAPILVNQWYTFTFGGVGSALADGSAGTAGVNPSSIAAPAAPWTFTLAGAGTLTVVDAFSAGDRFALTDFGVAIGSTSVPGASASCGNDITACLANTNISKGVFALTAGAHSIGGTTLQSPFGAGAAYFRVSDATAAVPEPATWAMMTLGFGAMGFAMRRRKVSTRIRFA